MRRFHWVHLAWIPLALLLLAAGEEETPTLRIIPDAWPRRPRLVGYEYHMKDRRNIPTEGTGASRASLLPRSKGRYRLLGVEVVNPANTPLEATITSRRIKRSKRPKIEVPPGGRVHRYFVLKSKASDEAIEFRLVGPRNTTLASAAAPLPAGARLSTRGEALRLRRELEEEEKVRERLPMHRVDVGVRDEKGRPVASADLTLLHERTGWLETGGTDAAGRWSGRLLAGTWTIIARKVFPLPPVDPQATVIPPSRVLYVTATAEVEGPSEVIIVPEVATPLAVENEEGAPLHFDRLWLAPRRFAVPLHFADVARSARPTFLLDLKRRMGQGGVEILGSPGVTYEIGAFAPPGVGPGAVLVGASEIAGDPIRLTLDPDRFARLRLDPASALGGTSEIEATVSLPDSIRVDLPVRARKETIIYVPPGLVRTRIACSTPAGERMVLAPHLLRLGPDQEADLTPRLPLALTPYMIHANGLQVWMALRDRMGRIVEGIQAEGKVRAAYKGQLLFEGKISDLRYQFPTGMDQVEVRQVAVAASLHLGGKEMRWQEMAQDRETFQGERAEVVAPGVLVDHARPYLEVSRKSLVGSERVMGLPRNVKRISNRFDVFLPPDVGGLGGGGAIILDLWDLIRFCAPTDALPWAYRHEFGHNLGFGHDPYMFMAPIGIDDELFGPVGYRMRYGHTLRRLLAYLDRPRPDPARPWAPSGDVFAALGLLYGEGIHKRMFEVRRESERILGDVGLSVIERIAVQYSVAAGERENLAWVFRAFDWPVLDERVWVGRFALWQREFRKRGEMPRLIEGLTLRDWWVQGPLSLQRPKGKDLRPVEEPPWRYLLWREEFVALPEGPPEGGAVGYRLFHRLESVRKLQALLICGSDVQLDLMVNGQTVGRIHASPQRGQPRHDDYRLAERSQSVIPVVFERGENFLEAVAIQPAGSKGFFLEVAGYDGEAIPGLRPRAAGPDDEDGGRRRPKRLDPRPPIHNPSFENGVKYPRPWIQGPVEPKGSLEWKWEDQDPARGNRCVRLRAKAPTRGAWIQRVIVEPESEYVLSGLVKSQKLTGKDCEAYICVFGQNPFGRGLAKTEVLEAGSTRWRRLETKFFTKKRRVAYVGCVVKASAGTVWFDEVTLNRTP